MTLNLAETSTIGPVWGYFILCLFFELQRFYVLAALKWWSCHVEFLKIEILMGLR